MNSKIHYKLNIAYLFCLLLIGGSAHAQDSVTDIIPFTGKDYVRVLIETNQTVSNNLKLKIKITETSNDQATLWSGEVQPEIFNEGDKTFLEFTVKNLSPELWTPAHPNLYQLEIEANGTGKNNLMATERVGFRSFNSQNGQIYLNGKPIFLRGIAINPPGRGIPTELEESREFALDYVKFMKSINVNIIRIPDAEAWYDVCDELGMMVFGGNYSGTVDGKKPPVDYESAITWYKREKLNKIAHHPSLMIYALTNEVPPSEGEVGKKWRDFLSYAHGRLQKEWDDTRLYIGNAGYGYGQSGDIADLHRYWGWYYSSPYTFLNIRYNDKIFPFEKPVQPITFTENVGNYTGPDGRYNLTPDHKNPVSQLSWTGHAPQNRQAELASAHQVHTFKQATELFRRLRVINPELSGIFPFTTMFHNWHTIEEFIDMDPKAVTRQTKISYMPILISWEVWQSQVYAGSEINPIVHIVNDSDEFEDLKNSRFVWQVLDKTKTALVSDTIDLPTVKYYNTYEHQLNIDLPADLPSDNYELYGKIIKNGNIISENTFELFIADGFFAETAGKVKKDIVLYDEEGTTGQALEKLGVPVTKTDNLKAISKNKLLIIGENSAGKNLEQFKKPIKKFINAGGRILVMRQDEAHLPFINALLPYAVNNLSMDIDDPTYPLPERTSRNGFHINPERPDHPIFNGLDRQKLEVWSDYTKWDESKDGMPNIYPVTDGFTLANKSDVAKTAILANYDIGLEGLALVEMFDGKGSLLLSGFDLVNRVELDPVADRLLLNMIRYMTSGEEHHIHPIINAPIVWGEFETEKGLLTGITSGFMLNSKPVLTGSYSDEPLVVTEEGHQFARRPGGWNNRAGLQYVPFGRRTFGPYYHRGFGGVPEPENMDIPGEGEFWCRVPIRTQSMMTLVWNPSEEELSTKIFLDGDLAAEKIIRPNAYEWIKANVNGKENLNIKYMGDRRLIYLETSFQ